MTDWKYSANMLVTFHEEKAMVVDSPSAEPAAIDARKAEKLAKKRRFEETKRRIQQLAANGELRFDPDGVEDGTNDPLPEVETSAQAEVLTRLRDEYARRTRNA